MKPLNIISRYFIMKKYIILTATLCLSLITNAQPGKSNGQGNQKISNPYQYTNLTNTWLLSSFSNNGVPVTRETSDDISNGLKSRINASLPEGYSVPSKNPDYLNDASKANIKLIENCELWVTFVSEGAGYCNTLGYFYYPTNTPPTSASQISKAIVVFPNASFYGSGGALREGNKVKLKYYDENTSTWSDVFPKGITVSWFLISNGWNGNKITNGYGWQYSIPEFNDKNLKPQQNLILYDKTEEKMVIGFEDIRRVPGKGSDEDFNDDLFYATANPITAVQTDDMIVIQDPEDTDHDGVKDTEDEFPESADKAFQNYYPGKDQFGTLAFEDQWPAKGDYDFNDFVTDYNFKTITNAKNEVTEITATFKVRAAGAVQRNGFAFQLETSADNITSVTGASILSNNFKLNTNGTESGQTKAVIPVCDDIIKLFGANMVNTTVGGNTAAEKDITINIQLKSPVAANTLGTAPYNPFLIVNIDSERGREVHLAGKVPTDLVNTGYFGKNEDRTDVSNGKYYVATQNFPWGLNFPASFQYPTETTIIDKAYQKFNSWVTTLGGSFSDWYLDKTDYRNNSYIYK